MYCNRADFFEQHLEYSRQTFTTDGQKAIMTEINISTPNHSLCAYLRSPLGEGPWPGVVVLHDVLGQTADSRRQVDWLAASGYLAVAPDLYSWGNKLPCIRAITRDLLTHKGATFDDIDAVKSFLTDRDDCMGKVGVIGFCMGGGFALLLVPPERGFSASSVNYGTVPEDAETLLRGACPVIGSFGTHDYTLKGAASRLENALQINGVDHDVKEYPDAGHAFLNIHGGALGWAMTRIGMRFHEPSAADAQARILAFFGRYLH
jgi:carboxymethylenebutenolidase